MTRRIDFFVFSCVALLVGLTGLAAPTQETTSGTLDPDLLSGLQLRTIGPANMSGRFVDIAVVESDPYTFYAASATGGVWKTTNNGVTFRPVFEREATHSVGDIAVNQSNPDIVWVGTGERANRQSSSWGDGIYKSTDGGKTWNNVGLHESRHIGRIVLHPRDPDVVYVAAMGYLWGNNPERGLYKTTDGGASWQRILYIDEMTGVVDVAMDPSDPQTLYAASYQRQRKAFGFHGGGPGSALYKTTDGGATWEKLTNGLPEGDYGRIGISIYRRNPDIVYACIEQGLRYTASISYEERKAGIYRSDDKGESWTFMSDWNPRPMYASQILVDPNDDRRIYMQNSFSWSTDGGKTFKVPRQAVHSDDRFIWVNPKDSRHVIKASDGALAISYDRAATWLLVRSLPVSQYYRVAVDMASPFNVYGGLQDNGSWVGPSATYRAEGVLNEDWRRIGGGDGFLNVVDPSDPNHVYVESQYLGLTRVDLRNDQKRFIRPSNHKGNIRSRRNWDVWGTGEPFPELGNQMAPANWDAPILVSPHDPKTLYVGTNLLWKSTDQGQSWKPLGKLTGDEFRSRLRIMGARPSASTPSLDDGIPYYPTLTAIAESHHQGGVLYVGADDGTLSYTHDGGKTWVFVKDRLPGAPAESWVSGIETSRYEPGVVYVVLNNYRNDDNANYLYKSSDGGESWESIVGDLPRGRVLRTLREDPRNRNVLYLGAELGLFYTFDGGGRWLELKNNLPTVAVNDLILHPRDNDLVLGTHGRGIWILDNVNALQELSGEVLAAPAHLFTIEPSRMIRYTSLKARQGDMVFKGQNPPAGATIDYYLGREAAENSLTLTVLDTAGQEIRRLKETLRKGINRVVWDLRYPPLPDPVGEEPDRYGKARKGPKGPWVAPGRYRVRLELGGAAYERELQVLEDPRIDTPPSARKSWTARLLQISSMYGRANSWLSSMGGGESDAELQGEKKEVFKLAKELRRRLRTLYSQVLGWTGPLTEDQKAQVEYFQNMMKLLEPRVSRHTGGK